MVTKARAMKLKTRFQRVKDIFLLILTLFTMLTQFSYAISYSTTDAMVLNSKTTNKGKTTKESDITIDTESNKTNTKLGHNSTATSKIVLQTINSRSEEDLPIALIIASPAVAVCVFIFICITYKVHSKQLDEQSKKLSAEIEIGSSSPRIPSSPCRSTAQRLVVPGHAISETDLIGQRRKSLRTPTPPPPGLSSKRGSCLSALSDQEILARASPRRHSTFIL